MKNEFGEDISEDHLLKIINQIQALEDPEIDNLWFNCGFIISDREKGLKAIRKSDIERIRESSHVARITVWSLLAETPLQTVLNNLNYILKCRK